MLTVAGALLIIAAAVTGAALIVRAALAARGSGAVVRADSLVSGAPDGDEAGGARRPNVVGWRFGRLLRAGCDARLALHLAERPDTDVHAVVALIRRGCPAPLAARIAEPLPRGPLRRRPHHPRETR
jgi:hypothetical protein